MTAFAKPQSHGSASEPVAQHEKMEPKFVTVLREGYNVGRFKLDLLAGITVAMVALPLSMAIAKASGTTPDRGLFTAVVGGFLISLLGGSRYQIGGPAGAFIVLVSVTIERHGIDGLMLAVLLSGVMMLALGFLRLGAIIKYIPHPVTVGFTSGIAVIIFCSQLVDLFGLQLAGREPGALIPKFKAMAAAISTINPAAVLVSGLSIGLILWCRKYRPHWPGLLITIVASGFMAVALSKLGVSLDTIGSKFGGIPNLLPAPHIPDLALDKIMAVLPDAVAFTLLGSIESLLSAVVADSMTGRRHRSNMELVAQGVGNIGSALFGGICVTGTIARTATNVRAGGTSPVSGMIHAVVLLLLMMVAAPLASYIPLAALAAVLAVVSWNMAEKKEFAAILRHSREDSLVVLSTFGLTIFRDLTEGILVGVILGSLFFIRKMAHLMAVEAKHGPQHEVFLPQSLQNDDRIAYARLTGSFFFGSAADVSSVLEQIGIKPQVLVIDFSAVPFCDGSAAHALHAVIERLHKSGTLIILTSLRDDVAAVLATQHIEAPLVERVETVAQAGQLAQHRLNNGVAR
jgi:SulP family sulfate permease